MVEVRKSPIAPIRHLQRNPHRRLLLDAAVEDSVASSTAAPSVAYAAAIVAEKPGFGFARVRAAAMMTG